MHTKESLIKDLKSTNIDPKGTVMVHSSMKSIGEVSGGADTVIDALIEYFQDGLLLLPTHSWKKSNLDNDIYDSQSEPACVGILPNIFLERPNVYRSCHPTHSVAAYGPGAKEYIEKDNLILINKICTPCSWDGCFGSLYSKDATILFLGASLQTNTFLHAVEEYMHIPNRINGKYRNIKIKQDTHIYTDVKVFGHHCTCGDISHNYDKIHDALLHKRYMHLSSIGDAMCYVIKAKETADMVISFLKKDPDLFVDEKVIPPLWYR